jgi:hypothetical protein
MLRCTQHDSFGHMGHNGVLTPSVTQDDICIFSLTEH